MHSIPISLALSTNDRMMASHSSIPHGWKAECRKELVDIFREKGVLDERIYTFFSKHPNSLIDSFIMTEYGHVEFHDYDRIRRTMHSFIFVTDGFSEVKVKNY